MRIIGNTFEENGAVNFLLAQMTMPDEQVLATAKTTRLLLGIQVQCTQCHNHPFNDWKQGRFWELNAFFRQAKASGDTNIASTSPGHTGSASSGSRNPPSSAAKSRLTTASSGVPAA